MTKRDKQIDGEYDRPLPDRTETLAAEELEELFQKTLAKHRQNLNQSEKWLEETINDCANWRHL